MQSEADFEQFAQQEEAVKTAYQYFMRVDPEMRDILGPIEEFEDELTGRPMRKRWAKVGMTRGVSEENMKEMTVYLDPFPHIRQEKGKDLQGWYSSKGDNLLAGQRDRPCETDAILTQPYGGFCSVGCVFCYINSGTRGYRGSGLISVPVGYGDHVRKQLRSMQVSAAGYFSSFTDPFLPLEEWYHNTQSGATAFVEMGLPIFFLSRLHYPGWAFDLLSKNKYSYAQKSINTGNPETWKKLSPGAISLDEHLDEIRELRRRGIYVSIQCNPIIPGVVDHDDVELLFERLAEAGANHVIVKFVEAGHAWAGAMRERIAKKFPGPRSERFAELFTENQGGGQKTIVEPYRREAHARYQAKATSLGMTYALCYEFTKSLGGIWRSMGPEFLTADQCHGHRVPMHRALDITTHVDKERQVLFTPIEDCPPSGCLRCADSREKDKTPPCGSTLLPQAKALRLPDYRSAYKKHGHIPLNPA